MKRKLSIFLSLLMTVLALTSCGGEADKDKNPNNVKDLNPYNFPPSNPIYSINYKRQSDTFWQFRSIGTMNLARDPLPTLSVDEIDGEYTENLRTAINYGAAAGANYVEQSIIFSQKPTLEELVPYYVVVPKLARERGLYVYYRVAPNAEQEKKIVSTKGEEFEQACKEYFADIKRLWVDLIPGLLQDGDIVSTWAEGDMRFTDAYGWVEGCAQWKEYLKLAGEFIDELKLDTGIDLLYTESFCGGEARIRDQFDAEVVKNLDFISWDHYAGVMNGPESIERMEIEAQKTAECIEKYSKLYGVRIALGEWSTHWDEPKTKEVQAQYIQIMMDALKDLKSENFVGMEYFHFALPQKILEYKFETTYYASPVVDKTGTFLGYDVLRQAFIDHSK